MKSVFTAGVLLLGSALAQAQSIYWTFSYTGFLHREAGVFLPDQVLSGSFSGNDADGDGVLELPELATLLVGGTDYVACAAGSNDYYYCGVDRFSFSAPTGLSFSLGSYGSDPEGLVGGGRLIESGSLDYTWQFSPGNTYERSLVWTDDTLLQLAPVPEPGMWAMLGLGLGGIALRMRRRGSDTTVRQRTEP